MNFVERKNPQTTLTYSKEIVPNVTISEQALAQMFVYTREVADEVGWLGTVYRNGNHFHINETFLFDQQVHGTTTEITPEGLEKFAMTLLSDPGKIHLWNDIKMWGHSHVNMGITPSGQDDKQMSEFSGVGHEYFIRLICNKKGELGIDVFLYEEGLTFKNVPWTAHTVDNPRLSELEQQMEQLRLQAEAIKQEMEKEKQSTVTSIEEPIKAEIKEKVKKLVYSAPKTQGEGYQRIWWDQTPDIYLEDWFSETEILYLEANVRNRADFERVIKELGVTSTLTYQEVGAMYSELIKGKYKKQ